MLKNLGQLLFSTSSSSTSCVKTVFLPTTSPRFGGDKREGAGVENYFFNRLLRRVLRFGSVESFDHFRRNRLERRAHRMRRDGRDDRAGMVSPLAQFANQRQLAQERHVERTRQRGAAAVSENLVAMVALAANVIAHVLDHAEHRHVHLDRKS